jgi:methylase of polypeptide subunit release factors
MFCHEVTCDYLAGRLRSKRILELCCGVGAITTALSKHSSVVFAVDADPLRIRCAEINVETYGNPDNAQFRQGAALSETIWKEAQPDVVVADPDWAKPGHTKSDHTADLSATQPPVPEILGMAQKMGVSGVVIRLSPKSDLSQLEEWEP